MQVFESLSNGANLPNKHNTTIDNEITRGEISQVKYLFFSGQYNDCLNYIRLQVSQLNEYEMQRKDNLAILGAQCLFELGKGHEMKSFLEVSYKKNLFHLPAMVFFVWIHFLLHEKQFDLALTLLNDFKKVGKLMGKEEKEQYAQLVVFDVYCAQNKFEDALTFLYKEYELNFQIKQVLHFAYFSLLMFFIFK